MDLRDGGVRYSSFEPTEFVAGVPNQPLAVHAAVEASGDKNPNTIYINFYASTDTNISDADYYLGQINLAMSVNSWTLVTLHSTLPASIPPGTYYVGWIIDPTNVNTETSEANNTAFHAATLLTVTPDAGQVLYVDLDASGAGDGSSWDDAFLTLQDALAQAESGCRIRVAGGVYTPDRGAGAMREDRKATFELKSGVTIIGGYAGVKGANPDARDSETWPTILSGDLNRDDTPVSDPCDLWMAPSRDDNSLHVVTAIDVGDSTLLDGVHVIGGFADGWFGEVDASQKSRGGGLYVSGGAPRLENCVFSGSWASAEGGAVCAADSSLQLVRCTLCRNAVGIGLAEHAGIGGAVFFSGGDPTLVSCSLYGNFACGAGGAVGVDVGSGLSAINCSLHDNRATTQAGGVYAVGGQLRLMNCTFTGNRQDLAPGEIVCESSDGGKSRLEIANCIVWDSGQPIAALGDAIVSIAFSDVWGGWPGVGNLNADPLFIDAQGPDGLAGTGDEDLRLSRGSPCIDAGDDSALPEDTTDLDGDQDTQEPLPLDFAGLDRMVGGGIDLGAYEAQASDDGFPY